MTHRVVFLDRATLRAQVRKPACASEWVEHDSTQVEEILGRLAGASVAIVNKVPMRAQTLEQLPDLRLIAVAATGYDVVDLAACKSRGIAVSNVRGYAAHTVPEHTFMMILALRRNLFAYRRDVEQGAWQRAPQFCFFDHELGDLYGATLGIVGAGAIGRSVGAIGAAFGMRVIYADHEGAKATNVERVPLPALLAESDVVSLHLPLTPSTRHLLDEAALRSMKRSAILVNTARGGLVDERALVRALEEGWIAGAGFDVLTVEPPREGNPLLELRHPRLLLTPHVAWASAGAMQALADQLVDNIDAWAQGRPQNLVSDGTDGIETG